MPDPLFILSQPIDGTSFGLNFCWRNDRFEHVVFAKREGLSENLVLISSLEGDDAQEWPSSPPLQDIHVQEIGGNPVAMAVGMAGTSHWSAACTLNESADEVRFHFDLACRTDGAPAWLGSSYQNDAEVGFHGCPATGKSDQLDGFEVLVRPIEVDGQTAEIRLACDEFQLSLMNLEASNSPKSRHQTFRWQYELVIRRIQQ